MNVDELIQQIQNVRHRRGVASNPGPELREKIQQAGATLQTWEDPSGTTHSPHDHPYAHRVLCVHGWIEFTVKSETYRLDEGDTLDLPPGVTHSAQTRPTGPTEYWLIRTAS